MGQLIFKNKKTNVLIKTTRNQVKFRQVAIKGDDGASGVGVSSININADNDFIVTYTDGKTQNAGRIKEHDPNLPVLKQELVIATANQQSIVLDSQTSGALILSINGVQQVPNVDYTLTNDIVYFVQPLEENDQIFINYSVPLSSIESFQKKIAIDNIAGNQDNTGVMRLLLTNNEVKNFSGNVILKDMENIGCIASWRIEGCISKYDTNNSISFVGNPTVNVLGMTQEALNNGFNLILSTDSVNGALQIKVIHTGLFLAKCMAVLELNEFI